ncbi:turripeptide OL11-like [Phymastichus coffea]|uniref:turripeptide OL11-like n=1 Tax=Phymastichus coffea TaxID=108790 RepID=UPI00273CCCC9|nr:turripeptide OL11-like [Phymastichus coffea]
MGNLKVIAILCVILVIANVNAAPRAEMGNGCLCPNTMELLPVCASNGRTYPNAGAVRCENKCKRLNLRIVHNGKC